MSKVGKIVGYWPSGLAGKGDPREAKIVTEYENGAVDLEVLLADGTPYEQRNVQYVAAGEQFESDGNYCFELAPGSPAPAIAAPQVATEVPPATDNVSVPESAAPEVVTPAADVETIPAAEAPAAEAAPVAEP